MRTLAGHRPGAKREGEGPACAAPAADIPVHLPNQKPRQSRSQPSPNMVTLLRGWPRQYVRAPVRRRTRSRSQGQMKNKEARQSGHVPA